VGRPTAILVDGEKHALVLGQPDQILAGVQVGDEGLLAQNVFSRLQRRLDDRDAVLGVQGDVDDVDVAVIKQRASVVLDPG
jgi:hypothetical protein